MNLFVSAGLIIIQAPWFLASCVEGNITKGFTSYIFNTYILKYDMRIKELGTAREPTAVATI